MLAELLPAVPGVLSWCVANPAAVGKAAPALVLLVPLKLLGVIR